MAWTPSRRFSAARAPRSRGSSSCSRDSASRTAGPSRSSSWQISTTRDSWATAIARIRSSSSATRITSISWSRHGCGPTSTRSSRLWKRPVYNPADVRTTSSAPTRIDLAGGTIDIWPLYLFHDGAATLNAAISLRAHVEIASRADGRLELHSIDADRTVTAARWSELDGQGELSLLALLARHYRLENATLTTRGESPAGAGIAGSSALTIALCGALAEWTGASKWPADMLQVAMNVQCQTISHPTGDQD